MGSGAANRTEHVRCCALTALLSAAALIAANQREPTPLLDAEQNALGKAAVAAYVDNVQSFGFYKCRYTHTKAQAASVEDAIKGKFVNARTYENRLIVDGDKDLYEGFAPPPDPRQARPAPGKKRGKIVASPGISDGYLADGQREMNHSRVMKAINLFRAERAIHGIDVTPFSLSVGHRSRAGPDARLAKPESYRFACEGWDEIDGRSVVVIRFQNTNPNWYESKFALDPSRGHFPVRRSDFWNGKLKHQVFVTHFRECTRSRWFPDRTVSVHFAGKPGQHHEVQETKLLDLDTDKRPDPREFALSIPAGTAVHETSGVSFRFKQDEVVHVEDLPRLFDMLGEKERQPLMDTALPVASRFSWMRWVAGACGLALLFAGILFYGRRRRVAQQT